MATLPQLQGEVKEAMLSSNATTSNLNYPPNINLQIDPWLKDFMLTSSIVNLGLAVFSFAF